MPSALLATSAHLLQFSTLAQKCARRLPPYLGRKILSGPKAELQLNGTISIRRGFPQYGSLLISSFQAVDHATYAATTLSLSDQTLTVTVIRAVTELVLSYGCFRGGGHTGLFDVRRKV